MIGNIVLVSIMGFGFPMTLSAADVYWTGGGSDNSWGTSGNWSNGVPAGNTVWFDTQATNRFTQNLATALAVDGVVVGNPGEAIVVTNALLTVYTGGIDMSRATRNFSARVSVGSSQTWTVTNGITLTPLQNPVLTSGRTLTLTGDGEYFGAAYWVVGNKNGTGMVVHRGGTLSFDSGQSGPLFIGHSDTLGQPGVGTYTLDGGTIRIPSSKTIHLGFQTSFGDGRFNLYSGLIAATNGNLYVGSVNGALGAFTQTNGTAVFSTVSVPQGTGATGTVVQSGGTLTAATLYIGTVGSGTMTVTNAGVLNLSGTATVGSGTAGTQGTLNLDGGTVNILTTSAALMNGANGTITANGVKFSNQTGTSPGVSTGNVTVAASMVLGPKGLTVGPSAGSSRWLSLAGNLSGTGGVTFDSQGGNTFGLNGANNTFSGGIVVLSGYFGNGPGSIPVGSSVSLGGNWALSADATVGILTGTREIFSGPGTIRTLTVGYGDASSGFSGTVGVGSSISIALTKIGTGTLTLSGVCTYAGGTIVSNGVLEVGGRIAPTNNTGVTVVSPGCLAGTGRVDRVVVQDGGRLMPGTAGACGTLTVSNLTLSANSVVVINAGAATNSTLNVTGTGTTLTGTVRVESVGGKNTRRIVGLNIPGGYTGTFDKVESASGNFPYTAVYGDKTVTLVPMIGTMIKVY